MSPRIHQIAVLGFAGLALLAAFAAAGWRLHGEAIFLAALEAGWATCF